MRRRPLFSMGVVLLAASTACSDSGPSSPAPAPGAGESITGRERIGWTQPASSPAELALYRYALYVDGVRRVLEGETCAGESRPGGFDCSAPLPALAPGRHTLELAAFMEASAGIIEGTRSSPLQVTVTGGSVQAPVESVEGGPLVSSDGVRLNALILVRDLLDPVDLAVAEGGRVFVAEHGGRVHSFDAGEGHATGAEQNVLHGLRDGDGAMLLSIAIAPDFPDTRLLYAGVLMNDRDGPALRIIRFREAGERLGEAAVVASLAVPDEATARIRFGPDRHLYIALGSGREPELAQDLASPAGKILRLRADGTRPDDNPGPSPVFSLGHREPRGLAWRSATQELWAVDRQDEGLEELNRVRPGGNYGAPVVAGLQAHPGAVSPVLILPPGVEATGVTSVPIPSSPFFGDLIVSAAGAEDLLRVRVSPDGRALFSARLLQGRFGRIGTVESASDGSLYFLTDNSQKWGSGRDMLIRVWPG